MNRIIVFDLETTGLYPEKGAMILEIGAVPIVNGEIQTGDTFDRFVNPEIKIPPHITRLNNITDEMVKEAGSIDKILPEFLDYIGNCSLVAHNAAFDVGFLQYFMKKYGKGVLKNPTIDTMALSKRLFSEYTYHNLDSVLRRLGIVYDKNGRHRSMEDAYLTAKAYLLMKRMLRMRN